CLKRGAAQRGDELLRQGVGRHRREREGRGVVGVGRLAGRGVGVDEDAQGVGAGGGEPAADERRAQFSAKLSPAPQVRLPEYRVTPSSVAATRYVVPAASP